jgi:nitrite reductase (NO-forming)
MTIQFPAKPGDFTRRGLLMAAAGASAILASSGQAAAATTTAAAPADIAKLPRVKQELVAPPFLPKHDQVDETGPKIVEVTLVIEEKKIEIDDQGTTTWAFTYNGSVPGPMIVVHEGDYVELTLKNLKTNVLEHNIDFHAATGALGGGALTKVMPGEQVMLRWKATKTGVFVYHCAPGDVMIPYHVVQGMSGAIMVLPRQGLSDGKGNRLTYDQAYYIGEQDFYIPRDAEGNFKSYEGAADNMADAVEAMKTLTPTHVVFNGRAGALTGDKAMKAKVGENVLFVHAQANRDTRPHLIGGHGDYVWETGSFADTAATGLETWFIRGGSAGAMLYKFVQPGLYAYVNHNLIEAVLLGAAAHVVVEGTWDDDLMTQVSKPAPLTE